MGLVSGPPVSGRRSTVAGRRLPVAETSTVEGGRESRDPLLQRMYQSAAAAPAVVSRRSPVAGRRSAVHGLRSTEGLSGINRGPWTMDREAEGLTSLTL